jgi:hydroxyacylglutathione hydrolase
VIEFVIIRKRIGELMKETTKIIVLQVGPVQTNCYIVANTETKEAICFDPGEEGQRIAAKLKEYDWNLKGILLTHCHFDHILGIPVLQELAGPVPVYAAKTEQSCLNDVEVNLTQYGAGVAYGLDADQYIEDGTRLMMLGQEILCLSTPGHTADGMCYYFPEEEMIISGDTLFRGTVGRTDLPTANGRAIVTSIKEKLLPLPENTVVYPGHGAATTIKEEKAINQFLR